MKSVNKIIALLLSLVFLLSGCSSGVSVNDEENNDMQEVENLQLSGMDDEKVQSEMEDNIYNNLIDELGDDYLVESVQVDYVSELELEYLEQLEYNSETNTYFGYKLEDLNEQFKGQPYKFTLGDDGSTVVVPDVENPAYDYSKIIKDVAIGTGVILICVTASYISGAVNPSIGIVFATSAEYAIIMGIQGAEIAGLSTLLITGAKTGEFDKAKIAALESAAEGYKVGAITGALTGTATGCFKYNTGRNLEIKDKIQIQKDTHYSPKIIALISSKEEYEIYRMADLVEIKVNNKPLLVRRDIDLYYKDKYGLTNLERMKKGKAPIDPETGKSFELHHMGQSKDGPLAILKQEEHRSTNNYKVLHKKTKKGVHNENTGLSDNEWKDIREAVWKEYANYLKV